MQKAKHNNGIRHPKTLLFKSRQLRKKGKTHREISRELKISLGSAELWTRGIILSSHQKTQIQKRRNKHKMSSEEKSRVSERMKLFWLPRKYKREDLINRITEFYNKNGRIPLKREFNSFELFQREFGSWNNAIVAAGFEPNPILFTKKFISRDEHFCDSFSEKIIDDWLFKKHIKHERHWQYIDTRMTADFFIQPKVIIEFFGLAGVQKNYDARVEKKRIFCSQNNFQLIEIYPKDIFPINKLEYILSSLRG